MDINVDVNSNYELYKTQFWHRYTIIVLIIIVSTVTLFLLIQLLFFFYEPLRKLFANSSEDPQATEDNIQILYINAVGQNMEGLRLSLTSGDNVVGPVVQGK